MVLAIKAWGNGAIRLNSRPATRATPYILRRAVAATLLRTYFLQHMALSLRRETHLTT
jgi:hypothetical protein